jgi:hypothetical protein
MKIADLFRRHSGMISPNGAGNGVYPGPRLVRSQLPQQPEGVPSYAELLAERNRLIRAEAAAERRLLELRGQLDQASNDLLAAARTPAERTRIKTVAAGIAAFLPRFAGAGECTDEFVPGILKAYVYPPPQQFGPSASAPGHLRLRSGPPQPAPEAVASIDQVKQAQDIVNAGRAAGRQQGPAFVAGPPQPRQGADDPARLAESIVRAGRRVRDGD